MPTQPNQSPAPLTKKQRKELRRQEKLAERERIRSKKQRIRVISWGALISALVIGVLSIFYLTKTQKQPVTTPPLSVEDIQSSDHIAGNKKSKTVLIEYSDFQCPACGAYYPMVKQLKNELGNSFAFIYRHFPLLQNKNAELAAQSAEAAAKQGKFWEMHDKLFENQSSWSDLSLKDAEKSFTDYAESLGLDINKFKEDVKSAEIKTKVENDKKSGERASVNATPSFFLNNELISPKNYDEFKQLILKSTGSETATPETTGITDQSTPIETTETPPTKL